MRIYFLHGGPLELMDAVDRSSRSRPGYMTQTDAGENTQVGAGLSGSWGQHIYASLERDGMQNFVRTLEFEPSNSASGQLRL